jgi:hypothetical protein
MTARDRPSRLPDPPGPFRRRPGGHENPPGGRVAGPPHLALARPPELQEERGAAGIAVLERHRVPRRLAPALLLAIAIAAWPVTAGAQVFLGTRGHPEFEIGPLFIRASIGPELGPVTVDVLWSLAVPPTRSALGLEQDLYLLWPAQIQAAERVAGSVAGLGDYIRSRGFAVTGEGRLPLFVEDLYPPPGTTSPDRRIGSAPFVSFRHVGLETLGVQPAASMIRIPWTPDLVNRIRLVKLRLELDGALRPKPANWLEELVRGPRHVLSLSFHDVRNPALFPLYLENRARALDLASEPSQLLVRFADPKRLRIDDIFPRTAVREPADGAAGSEIVSAFLDTSEDAAPQVLSVQFGYASGLQAWAPILIPLAFFVLGRATGPLIERGARGLGRHISARLRFGGGATAPGRAEGTFLSRETLARIVPGRTTEEEVLALCGRDTLEEQERLGDPDRRTLVYRGRRIVPRHSRRLLWRLSSVSDWELEEQLVEIALERGIVQDVQVRVRRARLPHPDAR